MPIDARHARLRDQLRADPKRLERYARRAAKRLHKPLADASEWIFAMYEENQGWLVDAVVEGVLIEGGTIYHPEEPPRSIGGLTNG